MRYSLGKDTLLFVVSVWLHVAVGQRFLILIGLAKGQGKKGLSATRSFSQSLMCASELQSQKSHELCSI